jgi:thiaminase (transcriptional activator TenA)
MILTNVVHIFHGSVTRPPQFDAWIDMYGGDDFAREVREYRDLVDAALKTADETTLKRMEEHFIMCCKLEHMFWDQATTCLQWPDIVGGSNNTGP